LYQCIFFKLNGKKSIVNVEDNLFCKYEVWQKSNATDFLLTMNFIIFTNQGYPLQNSSFRQLHSDGGVVSIVRSSAGRILLEYLSTRRLCSSGCYPKYQNGVFSSGF
jgi:hypothetical protein